MGKYQIRVKLSRFIIFLIYLHKVYKLDFVPMLLAFEKFGRGMFYFFFIFAGRKIVVPRPTKLIRMVKSSYAMYESFLREEEFEATTEQERVVHAYLKSIFDEETQEIVVEGESEFEKDIVEQSFSDDMDSI